MAITLKTTETASTRNPLDLSEIRTRVSHFLSVSDCISCCQVSTDWRRSFNPAVWHSVDFNKHESFLLIPEEVFHKNAHLIRHVQGMGSISQAEKLQHDTINNIQNFTVMLAKVSTFNALCYEVIGRNACNLRSVSIEGPPLVAGEGEGDLALRHFPTSILRAVDSPLHPLQRLILHRVEMTRGAFSMMLQSCPTLSEISLTQVNILSFGQAAHYQHPNVKHLRASVNQAWCPDSSKTSNSLFDHFPNLGKLTFIGNAEPLPVSAGEMQKALHPSYGHMNQVDFQLHDLNITPELLPDVFRGLVKIAHCHDSLSLVTITGVLMHQATLENFHLLSSSGASLYNFEEPLNPEPLLTSKRLVQLIPRSCRKLKVLDIPQHEMDMDHVENEPWMCEEGLCDLRVRIKDLNTMAKIDGCIEAYLTEKRFKKLGLGNYAPQKLHSRDNTPKNLSTKQRVVRFLMRFEHLHALWLGTKVYQF
ncbi:hypothetical protein EDD21DRAFT_370879 [Dissophora ornata]|nr:hypothetical protein BGZ58_000045 [Dissophora ornata]KAI8602787.1 hypothetical protein EDD21DRAFT_370879 [Dissophora ornata]